MLPETVCADTEICDFPTVVAAVADVGENEARMFLVYEGNYVANQAMVLERGREVTLVANGAVTLTNNGAGPVFSVRDGSDLVAEGFAFTAFNDRALAVLQGGRAVLRDAVLVTIGVQAEGGAVLVEEGTLEAVDTLFVDNLATVTGGQLMARDSEVVLTRCRFSGGFADQGGGVGFVASPSPIRRLLVIEDSVFEDNLAATRGGALYLEGPVDVVVRGTSFVGNTAEIGGAITDGRLDAVALDTLPPEAPTLLVEGCELEGNTAEGAGGAIALEGTALTVEDSVLRDNQAGSGGAIRAVGSSVGLFRVTMCENTAVVGGATAVQVPPGTTWYWANNRLLENSADTAGAIEHSGGRLVLLHHNLLENVADEAAAVRSASDLELVSSIVAFNDGSDGVVAQDLDERANLYWGNPVGDLRSWFSGPLAPGRTSIAETDPLLDRYVVGLGCDLADDHYAYVGPLVDAGDPGLSDLDLSPPDIGAYGGPAALPEPWLDSDGDGAPDIVDCMENDPEVYPPDAPDAAYDGVDADCDLGDDYDADRDGFTRDEDCDDLDPTVNPAAVDVVGQDRDCVEGIDVDGDGFLAEEDCDDLDPTVNPDAEEDADPAVDRDCAGPADIPRNLVPRSCATAPAAPEAGWLATLAVGWWGRARSRGASGGRDRQNR